LERGYERPQKKKRGKSNSVHTQTKKRRTRGDVGKPQPDPTDAFLRIAQFLRDSLELFSHALGFAQGNQGWMRT